MKQTKTAIKELTAAYRAVLRHAFAVACGIVLVTSGAMATPSASVNLSSVTTESDEGLKGTATVTLDDVASASDLSGLQTDVANITTGTTKVGSATNADHATTADSATSATNATHATTADTANAVANGAIVLDSLNSDLQTAVNQVATNKDNIDKIVDGTLKVGNANVAQSVANGAVQLSSLDSELQTAVAQINTNTTEIATKANQSDVESALALKADAATTYTKTDVDNALALKADKATTLAGYGITDAYTTAQIDDKLTTINDNLSLKANQSDVESALELKADKSDVDSALGAANAKIADIQDGYAFAGDISATNISTNGNLHAGILDTTGAATIGGALSAGATTVGSLDAGSGTIQTTGMLQAGATSTGTLTAGATTVSALDAGSGTIQTTGMVKAGEINAGSGTIQTTGQISGGTLTTTGVAQIGGDLSAASVATTGTLTAGDTKVAALIADSVKTTGALSAGASTLDSATVTNDLTVNGNTNVQKLSAGATDVASLDVTNNATVGGTLDVAGKTTLGALSAGASTLDSATVTNGLTVNGNTNVQKLSATNATVSTLTMGGDTVSAIDTGATAATTGGADSVATVATVLKSGENAAFTGTNVNGSDAATVKDAMTATNTAVNVLNSDVDTTGSVLNTVRETAENANFTGTQVTGGTATTINGALSETNVAVNRNTTNIGDVKYTAPDDVAYGDIAANTDLTTAVAQVAKNIGDAPTTTQNGVAATKSVNENIDSINAAIGNRAIASANVQLNNATSDNIAAGLWSLGDTVGSMDLSGTRYLSGQSDVTSAFREIDSVVGRLDDRMDMMRDDMQRGFAGAAAMSALVPNARANGDTQLSFGTGVYHDKVGIAAGMFHYVNNNVLFNAGAAYGGSNEFSGRAGVTFSW